MLAYVHAVHLGRRYLDAGLVVAFEQRRIDDKTGRGLRGAKKVGLSGSAKRILGFIS